MGRKKDPPSRSGRKCELPLRSEMKLTSGLCFRPELVVCGMCQPHISCVDRGMGRFLFCAARLNSQLALGGDIRGARGWGGGRGGV